MKATGNLSEGKTMARNRIQVRLTTQEDNGFNFTAVECDGGILGGLYYLDSGNAGFLYTIQKSNGYLYNRTFENELDALRYLVRESLVMGCESGYITVKLDEYCNSEHGAIRGDIKYIAIHA